MTKKVLYIIESLEKGGAERHLSYLLPELKKNNWDVSIVTFNTDNSLLPIFLKHGIKVYQPNQIFFSLKNKLPNVIWSFFYIIYSFTRLWFIFRKNKKSVLHFFLPKAYLIGSFAAIFSFHKSPRIMSRRSMNVYSKNKPIFRWIEKILHKKTFFILANSKKVLEELLHDEDVPSLKTGLIYNGVIDTYTPAEQKNNNYFKMTIVANLILYKGHEDLLSAVAMIKDKLPSQWILNIVGSDPQNRMLGLKKYAEELKINENIIWNGEVENIEAIWSKTNVGILCSHQEGFSNSILEAMRAEIPMIVTNVGGNAEAITHNVCGLVVAAHNPVELSKAICELANNPLKCEVFGKNARERFLNYFSIDKCVRRYEHVYNSILENSYPQRSKNFEIICP